MTSSQGKLTLALTTVVLLALPSFLSGEILHVRPTLTNTSCATHPCHTLSEYAHLWHYFRDSNLTLHFLPGNHALNVNLTIRSTHHLVVLGNSSGVVPARIVCSSNVGITLRDISKVKIDGLAFLSCARKSSHPSTTYYGLYLQSVQTAEIIDCTFQDSNGSALGVVDSHVVMKGNNSFLNNCRLCSNGRCYSQECYGGGVFVDGSNLSFTGSNSFIGNSAGNGGAVYVGSNSNVNISGNSIFIGNTAGYSGGGVYARSIANLYTFLLYGSSRRGMYIAANSNVDISGNTTFIGNAAKTNGGGVYLGFKCNLHINGNTNFINNSAGGNGGGVYSDTASNITIVENTTFINNSASMDEEVYSQLMSHILNSTFTGNSAGVHARSRRGLAKWNGRLCRGQFGTVYDLLLGKAYTLGFSEIYYTLPPCELLIGGRDEDGLGGGVYIGSDANISGNTTFLGNLADDGGGIYAGSSSNANISGNTTFLGNLAKNGGGFYAGSYSTVRISGNTTFNGNLGYNGGGVYMRSHDTLSISGNTTFIANSAKWKGGGVYAEGNSNVGISENSTFIDNSAGDDGGGVYVQFGNVKISGNTTFVGNSAVGGGGVYAGSGSNVKVIGATTFKSNNNGGGLYVRFSSNVKISGHNTFSSNSAVHGGCMFVDSSLILEGNGTLTNCSASVGGAIYAIRIELKLNGTIVFSANKAKRFGGALYMHKSSLNLDGDNTFTANSAGSRGGGIYAQETKVSFSGTCLLNCNMAQLDGGGIYADSSKLNFSGNITIRTNTAQLGGGIYSDNNTFIMDGHIFERNVAAYYGGGIYTRRSSLTVTGNNKFVANTAGEGGGMYATANTILTLNGVNIFIGNKANISGGGIWLDNSHLALNGSNHFVECAASYEGGALFIYAAAASLAGNNTFKMNSATTGGGIHARWSNVSVTNSCSFNSNIAVFGGGIYTDNGTFKFNGSSTFRGNQANYTGGGIHATRSALSFLVVSFITANHAAKDGGGVYTRDGCVLNLLGLNIYQDNLAEDTGGGISAFQSSVSLNAKSTFDSNKAVEGGGLYTFNCTVNFLGVNTFITNSAIVYGGGFTVMHSTLQLNGSTTFRKNLAASGGGMYISDSIMYSNGSYCFINNMAEAEGGGMYARDNLVEFNGKDLFVSNSAGSKGAAIHTSFTTLIFRGSSSFVDNSAEYGGGLHSEHSNLTFGFSHHGKMSSCNDCNGHSTITFLNNFAYRGGAQYFDLYSNFSLYQTAHVHFQDNHAFGFGGAIYVVDVSPFFSQKSEYFRKKSFLHIFWKEQSPEIDTSPLVFVNNSARIRGNVLYGGLLNKCNFSSNTYTSALELFKMSILQRKGNVGHSITSDPTRLCFCNISRRSCRKVAQSRSIFPGQQVEVSVLAVDQCGLTIPTLIHTRIHSGNTSETISYETGENCTSRNYSITPKNLFNQLELYPNNRSGNTIRLLVNITLKSCPIGFEQSNFTGECICDHRIWQYTNSCDIDRQAILRNASTTFWLGVSYNNGTFEGFIHHLFCPLDYCTSGSKSINFNNPDKQCDYNHSGLLCGKCTEGLSLVLGNSQCKQCSNNYLALLIPFALAGVLLVILLFLLHLTVAAGTLHGLIFYANIVAANHHIFFPPSTNNPANIFIAWLNLDLGIQTCFYNGMDAYAKTWLEFVFPIYIWVIVGILIYISHRSVTVTKLLGSSPVPVLSTLFFLSYAKILHTIISALSVTILHYPHKNAVVWIHDANLSMVKYIPLALMALLFLLFLFLPYTLILTLGQWLQPKSHFCLLSWVKNPKVKAILDTYHAPYKQKYRFWTGLLLLLHCVLFLIFAFNISGNDSINLLVISSTTLGIFVGFALLGKVYKNWYLNALEVSFILNLGMLAAATYHVNQSGGSQAAVAYTSVGIAFLTLVGIITYHIYIRIKSKVQYIQRGKQLQCGNKPHIKSNNNNTGNLDDHPRAIPTVTEVNLHELRSPLDLLSYHQMK